MKIRVPIILVMLVSMTLVAIAQEAADVDLRTRPNEEKNRPTVAPEPNVPELSQIDEIFKQTSLGREADERRLHVEWRELSNRVVSDPDIEAAKRLAQVARTDLEKRERLRNYYEIYYGRMRALASSAEMKSALDRLKLAHLSQTSQPRVRSAADAALPTPTPEPKHKGRKR